MLVFESLHLTIIPQVSQVTQSLLSPFIVKYAQAGDFLEVNGVVEILLSVSVSLSAAELSPPFPLAAGETITTSSSAIQYKKRRKQPSYA